MGSGDEARAVWAVADDEDAPLLAALWARARSRGERN